MVVSFVGWQGMLFLVVTMTIPVKRLVACVRCPVPGPPRSESWHGSGSAGRPVGVGRCIGFAVVMAQVRRPVPFRTRKLRPGRGDGTALERVWESSTPPHHTYRKPLGAHAPRGFPHIRNRPRPEPARAPGPPRIPMRPTPGTIPGQPRRRGRTTRRVRDRGSPTPGPPVCCADGAGSSDRCNT